MRTTAAQQKAYRRRARVEWDASIGSNRPLVPQRVDVNPVADHIEALVTSGWSQAQLARDLGMRDSTISSLRRRLWPRCHRTIAAAILAIDPLEPVTFDTVLVDRFVAGEVDWKALDRFGGTDERCEAARRMDRAGVSRNVIAAVTHLNSRTLWAAFDAEEIAS